jgi:hypothetical protein
MPVALINVALNCHLNVFAKHHRVGQASPRRRKQEGNAHGRDNANQTQNRYKGTRRYQGGTAATCDRRGAKPARRTRETCTARPRGRTTGGARRLGHLGLGQPGATEDHEGRQPRLHVAVDVSFGNRVGSRRRTVKVSCCRSDGLAPTQADTDGGAEPVSG